MVSYSADYQVTSMNSLTVASEEPGTLKIDMECQHLAPAPLSRKNWRISPEEDEELYGLQQQPEGRWRDHQEEEAKRSKEERLDRKKKARD